MEGKPKQVNYTRELKNALASGAMIECAVGPYEGCDVTYRPRGGNDPKPWLSGAGKPWLSSAGHRYSGRECRVRREQS